MSFLRRTLSEKVRCRMDHENAAMYKGEFNGKRVSEIIEERKSLRQSGYDVPLLSLHKNTYETHEIENSMLGKGDYPRSKLRDILIEREKLRGEGFMVLDLPKEFSRLDLAQLNAQEEEIKSHQNEHMLLEDEIKSEAEELNRMAFR